MCLKCVEACPTHAIHAVNFPVRKKEEPKTVEPKAASEQTSAAEVNTEKKEENV
jgi:ferredoxin